MLGLGRVFEGGIAGFFIALSSCGGDAFSVATDAAVNDSVSLGADANPAGDAPLAAGSDWCATQGSHTFCEDFSEGIPGQLMSANTGGAALSLDTTNFPPGADPPRSMLATTPNLPDMGDSAAAVAVLSFPDALGVHDILQADFDVASSCFDHGDKDGVTVLALSFVEDRYLIALLVQSSGSELLEVTTGLDGGTSNAAVHPFTTGLPLDKWTIVNLDMNLSGASTSVSDTATVKVNGLEVLEGEKLSLVPALGAHHPTLGLGANVKNDTGASGGCKVNVDDVFLDIDVM
jgi:hypothetical protein